MGRSIIDAHIHLWDLGKNHYPWLSGVETRTLVRNLAPLRRNYLIADLANDIGDLDVVATVHIQAEHDPTDPVRETRWLQSVADENPRGFPQAIVGDADFAREDVEALLEGHCAFPNIRGIRHVLHRTLGAAVPYDPLQNPAWHRNFPLLRRYGLSFDMQLFVQQADDAIVLIRDNPDVQIVLDHAAMPIQDDDVSMARWRHALWRYAAFPNVSIKISGFGTPYPAWNAFSIAPMVSEIVDAFTPRRVMLASNYPVEGLAKTYADVWSEFVVCFAEYSDAEQDLIFMMNAARIYRIDLKEAGDAQSR